MRYTFWLLVIIAAAIVPAVAPQTAYDGKVLTILYSGDTYGQLESCG